MAVPYMVALEHHIERSDSGYITLEEGDIVCLAGTSDDPEYEYVQLLHSDRVGWVRLSLLQSVLLSQSPTRLPCFHMNFALFGDNLVCQLITCFDTPRADIDWNGVSFAGWPEHRRPQISLNRYGTEGWDAAYLERLTSDLEEVYLARTGRPLSFQCEAYRGTVRKHGTYYHSHLPGCESCHRRK